MVGIGRQPPAGAPQRGDIHFVAFPDLAGDVIKGPHPAVVVQSNRLHGSSTTLVVPMTSAARAAEFEPPFLVKVAGRECGLPRDGFLKCDQPMTIPTALLGARAGRLNPAAIDRLDRAVRFVLEL